MRIEELKAEPSLLVQNQFFLKADNKSINYMISQACALSIQGEEGGAKILNINNGNNDYYFPYINGVNNIGCVHISHEELIEGIIVVTPAMNGCALDVRYNSTSGYTFLHDNNSRNFDAINKMTPNHTCVCRVDRSAYWDEEDIDDKMMKYPNTLPGFQFVCIYSKGAWHVGLSELYIHKTTVVQSFHCKVLGADVGVFNDNVYLRVGGYNY